MQSIEDVMIAIAAQVTDETGIRAGDVVPNAINPPEVFLHLKGSKPGTFGADSLELDIDVIAFVSSSVDRAQRVLYKYVSVGTPESLFDALSADPTFGLDDVSGAVGEFRNLGFDEIAAYKMYGGAISLAVSIS
jgi:hypothetical protein